MRKIALIAFALVSSLLAGCATSLGGANYQTADARVEQRVRLGTVYSVRNVNIESSGMIGTVAGALVGGLAGHGVGGGTGKSIITVLGTLGGAVAGNAIEKSNSANGVEITVRLENGELVAITQAKDADTNFRKGDLVRIIGSGRTVRVGQA